MTFFKKEIVFMIIEAAPNGPIIPSVLLLS